MLFRSQPQGASFFILSNQNGVFSPAYNTGNGFYNIEPSQASVFDFNSSGVQNYLALYNPGQGYIEIAENDGGAAYASHHVVPVPDVLQHPLPEAIQTIQAYSLKVGSIGGPTTPGAIVISEVPTSGTVVPDGQSVQLTTAIMVPLTTVVPRIIGMTMDKVVTLLDADHLEARHCRKRLV